MITGVKAANYGKQLLPLTMPSGEVPIATYFLDRSVYEVTVTVLSAVNSVTNSQFVKRFVDVST